MAELRLPNFVYIGPDKAGSTWLYEVLKAHPNVFVAPAKDTYFFDKEYHRGMRWYASQFRGAVSEPVVMELSHDYLFCPECVERMAEHLPGVRVMVCLREPVERAFSAYLYLLKHGIFRGTFEESLDVHPELLDHGRYATHLPVFLQKFGRDGVYVSLFDDLKSNPAKYIAELCDYLSLPHWEVPRELLKPTLAAAAPRAIVVAWCVKQAALTARSLGLAKLLGHIKRMPSVQRVLYKPFDKASKPRIDPATEKELRELMRPDVEATADLLGVDVCAKWGYVSAGNNSQLASRARHG